MGRIPITFIWFILWLCLGGCAASSTDYKVTVPQVTCTPVVYQGVMSKLCCQGETCVVFK